MKRKNKLTENEELSAAMQALPPDGGILKMMEALHNALEKAEDGSIGVAVMSYHRAEGMVGLHGMIFKPAEIAEMGERCETWKEFSATFVPGEKAHKIVAEQRAQMAEGETIQ